MRYDIIHNSYGSTNCIRFEGIISANEGTPLSLQRYVKFSEKPNIVAILSSILAL